MSNNLELQEMVPVNILGVKIDPLSGESLNNKVSQFVLQQQHALVIHVNVYGLNLAQKMPWLKKFYNQATLTICDGVGPIIGARILGYHIPERVTYMDWIWQLAGLAESQNFSMFFLGGKPGTANKAADFLQDKYPKLNIVGCHHGFFNKERDSTENSVVIEKINAVRPNLLFVGFGMPRQEKWLLNNWSQIDADVAFGPGALFDYLSDDLKRSPKWMTDNGLEWLGRFIIEPRRLWKRYLLGNPLFILRVIRQKYSNFGSD